MFYSTAEVASALQFLLSSFSTSYQATRSWRTQRHRRRRSKTFQILVPKFHLRDGGERDAKLLKIFVRIGTAAPYQSLSSCQKTIPSIMLCLPYANDHAAPAVPTSLDNSPEICMVATVSQSTALAADMHDKVVSLAQRIEDVIHQWDGCCRLQI